MSLKDLNPGWIAAGALIISVPTHIAVSQALTARDAQESREFQKQQIAWNANMEAKFNDQRNFTDKTLVGIQKDVESANKTLSQIQQAMMGRPTPTSLTSQHIP